MKTSLKKFTSVFLAALMLLSVIAGFSVSATSTVTLNASFAAEADPVWFAWTWGSGDGHWVSGNGGSSTVTFSGLDTNVVFVRMPAGSTQADWDTKWNQTEDLVVSGSTFTIETWDGGKDGNMSGSWSGSVQGDDPIPSAQEPANPSNKLPAEIPGGEVYPGVTLYDVMTTDNASLKGFSVKVVEDDGVKKIEFTAERANTDTNGYIYYIDGTAMNTIGYNYSYIWIPTAGTHEVTVERYNFSMQVIAVLTGKITVDESFFDVIDNTTEPTQPSAVTVEILESGANLIGATATVIEENGDKYIEIRSNQVNLNMPYETIFTLDGTEVQNGYTQVYKWTPEKAGTYTFTITVTKSGFTNQKCVVAVTISEEYFTGEKPQPSTSSTDQTEPETTGSAETTAPSETEPQPEQELPKGLSVSDLTTTDRALLSGYSFTVNEETKSITITAEREDTSVSGYIIYVDGEAVKDLNYGNSASWVPTVGTHEVKTERYNLQMQVVATLTAKLTVEEAFFTGDSSQSTDPTESETTASTESESTDPTESETTASTESESTDPTESETTVSTESELTDPTESESTAPTESESTDPTESETTAPTESELTDPTESESTAPTEPESTNPTETAPTPVAKTTVTAKADKTSIKVGAKTTVKAIVENAVGTTVFTSSNIKVATVDSTGKVTAKSAGTVVITVTNNGVKATVTIKVTKKANPMKVTKTTKIVKYSKVKNAKKTVKAITVKNKKGKVTFTKKKGSSKYLSVKKKTGKIIVNKGTKPGIYKIKVKVKAKGNAQYKSKAKTVTVKIKVN